jgi:hypothetical protein
VRVAEADESAPRALFGPPTHQIGDQAARLDWRDKNPQFPLRFVTRIGDFTDLCSPNGQDRQQCDFTTPVGS